MLSPDVRVEGFSAEQWLRLGELFGAPMAEPDPRAARGGIVAVTTQGRLRKLLSTRTGRLDRSAVPWPLDLPELAARHDASWAVKLTTGSLERLAEQFADRLRPSDSYLSQILELLRALRDIEAEGGLEVWPWPVAEWPIPNERAVVRALDAVCPESRVALIGVFERGELYTALAARRGARGFDAIVGPGEFLPEMGLLSGDWQRDYRFLSEATERLLGPLAIGCFGELYTFQSLAHHAPPGAWAAAVAARDIVLAPITPALAVPLGLDAGRVLLHSMRGLAERLGAKEWLSTFSPNLGRAMPVFEADIKAWLGFDPIKLLARLMGRRAA
jgi:hypothetical protein